MNRTLTKPIADDLVRPLFHSSVWFYAIVLAAGTVVACGAAAWAYQLWNGIGVAGIRWPVFWAFYLVNFVFWIGISHAGTLISAILRLVDAGWRRPVTRCAEVITVFALMIGAMFPIIHLGRPWLAFWLFPYPSARDIWPNFRSPLAWDFFAINTYLTGSVLFLFLPMIPDLALVRDRSTGWRRKVYGALSFGWRGTTRQWNRLESAMQIMAIAILPVAVSVHTIVSFDFSMANVPMWHSTIFGPYFVAGAIFSGIAALIIVMAVLRKTLRLEKYLLPFHFENLGMLLLLMCVLWAYFVFNERLTVWYGNEPHEMAVFWTTQRGRFAPLYWTMVICNFVIPFSILSIKRLRTIAGCVIASCAVLIGMWLERFLIIVPGLATKQLPYSWGEYGPRPVEITIMAATFAAMILLYALFAKFVPIISIWELKAGLLSRLDQKTIDEVSLLSTRLSEPSIPPENLEHDGGGIVTAIYGLYDDPHTAQTAVENLRAAGVADRDITVISSEPFDHFEFGHRDAKTAMPWIAAAAALAGMVATWYLLAASQRSWPLVTSGMPVAPLWTNLIIIFEMTMLSAIIATVIALAWTAFASDRGRLYDPEVSDGYILVGVEKPADASGLEAALALPGARVKRT